MHCRQTVSHTDGMAARACAMSHCAAIVNTGHCRLQRRGVASQDVIALAQTMKVSAHTTSLRAPHECADVADMLHMLTLCVCWPASVPSDHHLH